MSAYLTHAEIVELTGTPQKSLQIKWLRRNRWRFVITISGHPRVARDHWRRRMVADEAEAQTANVRVLRPNLAVLK